MEFPEKSYSRLRTDSFVDAAHKIEKGQAPFRLAVEAAERAVHEDQSSNKIRTRVEKEHELTSDFFDVDAPGKLPRRVDISGLAFTEDSVLAVEKPEPVELSSADALLHGIVFVDVRGDFATHHDAAFLVEDTRDGQSYYFPFWKVEHLSYAEQSIDVEIILSALEELGPAVDKWRASRVFQDAAPADRVDMCEAYRAGTERKLYEIIFDEDETTYEVDSDFYYVLPRGIAKRELNLEVFNSSFGGVYDAPPLPFTGTLTGVTFPVLEQPSLVDDDGNDATLSGIDAFEPCLMFDVVAQTRRGDNHCAFVVPLSKLLKVK